MFLHLCVILCTGCGVCVSGGSLSRGISVQREDVSVQGGLCPMGDLCPEGGLCLGGLCQGDPLTQ